jgi:adenosylcobinamide-phosphate synthase
MSADALVLAAALALDLTVREPPVALHPVVWMGRAIAPLKRLAPRSAPVELLIGTLYVVLVTLGAAFATGLLLQSVSRYPWVAVAIELYLLWSCFALASLCAAGREMAEALEADDLVRARVALGSLCSRDPSELTPRELAGATIESLTENTSDSVVAPLFYFALFGVPGAVLYRAANTLDAMVGYRGRYEYLGKFAARFDDLLNLVPARLTALLLCLAAGLVGLSPRRGFELGLRDHACTESPNAGWPMATAAGLLGVRLDKRGCYVLGAELGEPDARAVRATIALVRASGLLSALLFIALLACWERAHG